MMTHQIFKAPKSEHGAALIVSLLLLIVITILGISASQLALQDERLARNDRDHQIAFQAAEAALKDAETEIVSGTRAAMFDNASTLGFEPGCLNGLCAPSDDPAKPVWLTAFAAQTPPVAKFGEYSQKIFPINNFRWVSKLPEYVIEVMYDPSDQSRLTNSKFYRITAVGYGASATTTVALQSIFKKP